MINIDRKDLSGTIGGWIIGEPKKTLEEIIQQVKIDMYKDRYKAYDHLIRLIFMPILKKGN